MKYRNLLQAGIFIFSILFMVSCSDDQDDNVDPSAETYNTSVEVTDAPIDNAEVQGVFVTITNVTINGKALEGYQASEINLLALQNGNTQALGNVDLEAGATSNIVVELSGEAMANYVETTAGEKKELALETTEIVVNDAAEVLASTDNTIVLDFDLRKMIAADTENNGYKFVAGNELQSSIRAVNELNAGTIVGNVEDSNNHAKSVIVYAYKKGTFADTERDENASGIRFSGAVNSSAVSEADGSYSLNFLEEGEYELHYAAYAENATTGEMEFQGMLDVQTATGIDLILNGFELGADVTVTADVVVTGMIQ